MTAKRNEHTSKRVLRLSAHALRYFGNKNCFDGDEEILVGYHRGYKERTPFTVADLLSMAASLTTQAEDKPITSLKEARAIAKKALARPKKKGII